MVERFEIIGLMSGSSLDGLDLAWCTFEKNAQGKWQGQIREADAFSFPPLLEERLRNARTASALELAETDAAFVRFCADSVAGLCRKTGKKPRALASHGHTVFHNPASGNTTQIGNGGLLSGLTGIPVVSDFRTLDVGLGGQGAPLVPGAERFLFSDFEACLNLGGISNVSFPKNQPFLGFDISPCNQLLNLAASWLNLTYDHNGSLAEGGNLIPELMDALEKFPYYNHRPPKSLGNEDVARIWVPLVSEWKNQPQDVMHTVCKHVANQIASSVKQVLPEGRLLVTGGGAYHRFLVQEIQSALQPSWKLILPDNRMISFKEAYCFAFLGLKRMRGEPNCFSEVTGALADSSCGAMYGFQSVP